MKKSGMNSEWGLREFGEITIIIREREDELGVSREMVLAVAPGLRDWCFRVSEEPPNDFPVFPLGSWVSLGQSLSLRLGPISPLI